MQGGFLESADKNKDRTFYRYSFDGVYPNSKLVLIEFFIGKETKCGFWIIDKKYRDLSVPYYSRFIYSNKIFILKGSGLRYAYESKEKAWEDFLRLKRQHERFLQKKLSALRKITTPPEPKCLVP